MFTLKFSTANAAFDNVESEIIEILQDFIDHFKKCPIDNPENITVVDSNGNSIGQLTYTDK